MADDDFDVKDVAHPEAWMIRSKTEKDEEGRPLYWSDTDGWVTYAEADTYTQHWLPHYHPPLTGEWIKISESQSVTVDQAGDLREALNGEIGPKIDALFTGMHCLVERQWHPMGQQLALRHEDKTQRTFFKGPTLTVLATMPEAESLRIHEGEIGNARTLAAEMCGELSKLLPESVRAWPRAPQWDKFNRQWTFRFQVALREALEGEEGEYKDLYVSTVPPDFTKPQGLSPEGEKAWEVIVAKLKATDDLHSGGHTHVFYTPQEWAAKGEKYGEGSDLIVVHDGGNHAAHFNIDYGARSLVWGMDVALRKNGLYVQPLTSWSTAIYKWDEPNPELIASLEKDIADQQARRDPQLQKEIDAMLQAGGIDPDAPVPDEPVEEAIEPEDEMKEVGRSQIEQIILDGGFEIVRIFPKVGGTTVPGMYSTVVYTRAPERTSELQSSKAVALAAAKQVVDRITQEVPSARPVSYSLSDFTDYKDSRGHVSFWVTGGAVQEAMEDAELGEPISNEHRIRQLFMGAGLHIDRMVEEPRGDEPRWGKLNEPKRFIETVLQPSYDRPWTVSGSGSQELANFCRQVTSSLAEILATMDIDWTTRWDSDLGAWRVKWFIGDPGIMQHRVVEAFGGLEGEEDVALPAYDFDYGDIVIQRHRPHYGEWTIKGGGPQDDETNPATQWFDIEQKGSIPTRIRADELELVRKREAQPEAIDDPDDDLVKDVSIPTHQDFVVGQVVRHRNHPNSYGSVQNPDVRTAKGTQVWVVWLPPWDLQLSHIVPSQELVKVPVQEARPGRPSPRDPDEDDLVKDVVGEPQSPASRQAIKVTSRAEANRRALDDLNRVNGTIQYAKWITGYKKGTNDTDDFRPPIGEPFFQVRVIGGDTTHWNAEFLDPYWDIELLSAPPENLEPESSLWMFGQSYEVVDRLDQLTQEAFDEEGEGGKELQGDHPMTVVTSLLRGAGFTRVQVHQQPDEFAGRTAKEYVVIAHKKVPYDPDGGKTQIMDVGYEHNNAIKELLGGWEISPNWEIKKDGWVKYWWWIRSHGHAQQEALDWPEDESGRIGQHAATPSALAENFLRSKGFDQVSSTIESAGNPVSFRGKQWSVGERLAVSGIYIGQEQMDHREILWELRKELKAWDSRYDYHVDDNDRVVHKFTLWIGGDWEAKRKAGEEPFEDYVKRVQAQQEGLVTGPVRMLIEAGACLRSVQETEQEYILSGEWADGAFTVKVPRGQVCVVEDSDDGDDDRVGIVAVFRKNGQGHEVLVCRREVDPEAGKWCIPGGHFKVGETAQDGAKREMKEETHLDLEDLTFVKKMPNETREATVYVYGCMMPDGDRAKAGDDAEKIKWVPVDDLPELAFDNNELVKEVASHMGLGGKVEEAFVAWHASPYSFRKFDTSGEGAHFGTQEQAANLRKAGLKDPKPYLLNIENPLRIRDIGVWTIDGIATELHTQDIIDQEEADRIYAERNWSDRRGYQAIKDILAVKGYDGFVYANEQEGQGDSFVAFHAHQISPYRIETLTESKDKHKGFLIVFEGMDGAGKTTQVRRLSDWLNDHEHHFVTTKWNNSKLLSDVLWKAKKKKELTPMLFSLLHASDLHLRYEKIILPALAEGKVVLCDRYYYTSYVRDQIRGIDDELLDHVYKDFEKPDLVFHCVVPSKVAVARLMKDRGAGYYASGLDIDYGVKGKEASLKKYEEDMAKRYEKLLKNEPNVVDLDMDRPIKEIAKDIKAAVRKLLGIDEAIQEAEDDDLVKDVQPAHDWVLNPVSELDPLVRSLYSRSTGFILSVRRSDSLHSYYFYLSEPGSTFNVEQNLQYASDEEAIQAAIRWAERNPRVQHRRSFGGLQQEAAAIVDQVLEGEEDLSGEGWKEVVPTDQWGMTGQELRGSAVYWPHKDPLEGLPKNKVFQHANGFILEVLRLGSKYELGNKYQFTLRRRSGHHLSMEDSLVFEAKDWDQAVEEGKKWAENTRFFKQHDHS